MEKKKSLDIYLVGGALRDELLGKSPKDRDFIVLNADPADLLSRGLRPVGKSFEVYLGPVPGEEYALVKGDLVEDLRRRDLTINAMAKNMRTGEIIDPFNGLMDLKNKVLRRTSDLFAQDPIRVLRLARFQSELDGFRTDAETLSYVQKLCSDSKLFQNSAWERITKEFEKALLGPDPVQFIERLNELGALENLSNEFLKDFGGLKMRIKNAVSYSINTKWAVLLAHAPGLIDRFTLSAYQKKLCEKVELYSCKLSQLHQLRAQDVLELIISIDGLRNETLLHEFCMASRVMYGGTDCDRLKELANSLRKLSFDFNSDEAPELIVRRARLKLLKEFGFN